jgi:hypothetical protein
LLPTITIEIKRGRRVANVRCLIDTGSQRSYIAKSALERINFPLDGTPNKFVINIFLNSGVRNIREASVSINFKDDLGSFTLPFLIDEDFNLKFEVSNLNDAINNLECEKLADIAFDNNSTNVVELEGLLGVDAIQFFKEFSMMKCMEGSAFKYAGGLIPFGNVENFITKSQIAEKYRNGISDENLFENHFLTDNLVIFTLGSPVERFDGFDVPFEDKLDKRLDNLFSLESLGVKDEPISDFDELCIDKFESGIEFVDGKYNVEIPWDNDKLKLVKSNYNIAKHSLNRVVDNLKTR